MGDEHQETETLLAEALSMAREAVEALVEVRAERDRLRRQAESHDREREVQRREVDSLRGSRDQASRDRDRLRSEVDGLQRERDTLIQERDALRKEHEALSAAQRALREQHAVLKAEHEGLRVEIQTIQTAQARLAALQKAPVAAQPAVPTETTAALPPERRAAEGLPLRRIANLATRVFLVLCILGAGVILAPLLMGRQVYAVEGGSMEPTVPLGALIVVQPVAVNDLRVGDVITFADRSHTGVRVTHRIVGIETKEGRRAIRTRGDANQIEDAWEVPTDQPIARMQYWLPFAGYVVVFLASTQAKLALIGLVGVLLAYQVLPRGQTDSGRKTPARRRAVSVRPTDPR